MKPLATAAVAAVAICGFFEFEGPVFVGAYSHTLPMGGRFNDKNRATERNYGQSMDVEIAPPRSSSPMQPFSLTSTLPDADEMFASSGSYDSFRTASTSEAAGRVRLRERMIRPRSLNSSSNKIESANTVTKKSKYPELLQRDEEGRLTNSIRTLRAAVRIRDELAASRPNPENTEFQFQPTETEWAVACGLSVMQLRRVMHDGQDARSKLVSANGGLVHSIAKKHYYSLKEANQVGGGVGSILTLQDMVQEGNLGLMEAAERFEPERGFRFSTYATWWVRQRILRSISDYSRVIRLPAHVHSMLKKINKARKEMQKEIGRTPSVPELAHYLEMSVNKLQMYTDSSRTVLSLEVPVNAGSFKGDDRRTLGDKIASDSPTPEENAEVESLRRDIREVVNELAERERDVLVARFGLDDGTPKTVEETSKRLGISRDRVRLVEARALNKLRHPQRNYKLKEYVGGDSEEEYPEEMNLSPERIWSF